jgi:deazaflavin-dependent oxidoreductase (nitroreductase family)
MKTKKRSGSMKYPAKGSLNWIVYKTPLLLWRLGFGPFLSHPDRGGRKMLVVTTRGRKSGLPRHTMVSCIDFEQKNYVVSGWRLQSDWMKNIQKDPLVTIQVGLKTYTALARRVVDLEEFRGVAQSLFDSGGDSHFGDWLDALDIKYDLNDLMNKRERIHFVGFDPAESDGLDPLLADLLWIWAVILSLILGWLFFIW